MCSNLGRMGMILLLLLHNCVVRAYIGSAHMIWIRTTREKPKVAGRCQRELWPDESKVANGMDLLPLPQRATTTTATQTTTTTMRAGRKIVFLCHKIVCVCAHVFHLTGAASNLSESCLRR